MRLAGLAGTGDSTRDGIPASTFVDGSRQGLARP
jgi:hypothetical protein